MNAFNEINKQKLWISCLALFRIASITTLFFLPIFPRETLANDKKIKKLRRCLAKADKLWKVFPQNGNQKEIDRWFRRYEKLIEEVRSDWSSTAKVVNARVASQPLSLYSVKDGLSSMLLDPNRVIHHENVFRQDVYRVNADSNVSGIKVLKSDLNSGTMSDFLGKSHNYAFEVDSEIIVSGFTQDHSHALVFVKVKGKTQNSPIFVPTHCFMNLPGETIASSSFLPKQEAALLKNISGDSESSTIKRLLDVLRGIKLNSRWPYLGVKKLQLVTIKAGTKLQKVKREKVRVSFGRTMITDKPTEIILENDRQFVVSDIEFAIDSETNKIKRHFILNLKWLAKTKRSEYTEFFQVDAATFIQLIKP